MPEKLSFTGAKSQGASTMALRLRSILTVSAPPAGTPVGQQPASADSAGQQAAWSVYALGLHQKKRIVADPGSQVLKFTLWRKGGFGGSKADPVSGVNGSRADGLARGASRH